MLRHLFILDSHHLRIDFLVSFGFDFLCRHVLRFPCILSIIATTDKRNLRYGLGYNVVLWGLIECKDLGGCST